MRQRIFSLALITSLVFIACGNVASEQKVSSILSGNVTNILSTELYLMDLSKQRAAPLDTAIINEDGSFAFDYQATEMGFYRINLTNETALILPLGGDKGVTVNGNALNLAELEIKGSPEAETLSEFNIFSMTLAEKQAQLNQEFQSLANASNVDSLKPIFQNRFITMENEKIAKMKELIDRDPSLFSNLAIIEQLPADQGNNIDYYKKVNKALGSRYSTSVFYQNFESKMVNLLKFAVGSDVPEINLPDPNGNLIPLSSLRGQVVLIDFWASWCKPCRMENPNVVKAYKQFKDKGFTIYGVSLDRTKDAWVNAIEQDGLTWTHVSDLKFWQSIAAKDYGVSGIPFALLIDKDGKVIGKNLRGAALQQKLAEVLK